METSSVGYPPTVHLCRHYPAHLVGLRCLQIPWRSGHRVPSLHRCWGNIRFWRCLHEPLLCFQGGEKKFFNGTFLVNVLVANLLKLSSHAHDQLIKVLVNWQQISKQNNESGQRIWILWSLNRSREGTAQINCVCVFVSEFEIKEAQRFGFRGAVFTIFTSCC